MNRGIILVLVGTIVIGSLALYAIQRGPALFLKPPSEERIAFVSDKGGHSDIWTMRVDGSDKLQVTNDPADDQIPAWSPDGAELVSVSDRRDGTYQVFVSAWNGRYAHCMTTSSGTKDMPVWSGDGKEITFISGGKVYGLERHGGPEEQYLPPPEVPELPVLMTLVYTYAAWSPDLDYLLCVRDTDRGKQVYAVRADEGWSWADREARSVGITMARSLDAAWAPSGVRVAAGFVNRNDDNGLFVADIETLEANDLFLSKGDGPAAAKPVWSPDGGNIAFEMWLVKDGTPETCLGIYTIGTSGGEARQIISGDAREPSWSPDGGRLVCTLAREDGKRDVWRVNADGSEAVNLTDGEGDNYNPRWSPTTRGES